MVFVSSGGGEYSERGGFSPALLERRCFLCHQSPATVLHPSAITARKSRPVSLCMVAGSSPLMYPKLSLAESGLHPQREAPRLPATYRTTLLLAPSEFMETESAGPTESSAGKLPGLNLVNAGTETNPSSLSLGHMPTPTPAALSLPRTSTGETHPEMSRGPG